jgi:flavin reductase (DIM6/NTAB) family NADH-FMN oxidoreductase RutF
VRPPRVAESPVQMECRLREVVIISDQPGGGSIVIGEVLRFHVREDLFDNFRDRRRGAAGRWDAWAVRRYCRTRDRFDMQRPK